ncbi:phosphoenolpyruvate--protein phosphotransferase [Desulfosarcina sp. OttesenSCG-928-A07]|nr:phosphoenolpyruvate--protein phosphotransferase [Desulfosarcina sp. OttesenSCG-928-G17]MDL2330230.1 phosphoenolpyruvate--protein phosphotransferase [Desulfosarcina sp. OttesenSCG-928-A07]
MKGKTSQEVILTGIGTSPGICIGKAYLVDKEGVETVKRYTIDKDSLSAEVGRFKTAVNKAEDDLHQIMDAMPEDFRQHARILETHVLLLRDKTIYDRAIELIEKERINAEWALKKVTSEVRPVFEKMDSEYLRQRAEDITHVADRIMEHLVGGDHVDIARINKRVILVAKELSPGETSQIQLERIKGFVTNRGGRTSHTGIIARTLEVPAVLGVENATQKIKNDDIIIVDGKAGTVVINPSEQSLLAAEERRELEDNRKAMMARTSAIPAITRDGKQISIMGNIELGEEVVALRDHGGDGIGLYRTEFQYLSRSCFPDENTLFENYKEVIDVMNPRPVTIRTLDVNGDKAISYLMDEVNPTLGLRAIRDDMDEVNPALGLRAIRYCLRKPEVFQTQLRAILRAAVHGDVRILLPMISCLEELEEAITHINMAAKTLKQRNVPHKRDIPVGIMIEVPSAAITADILAKKADFFSIGTNDLIQYTLAIDRGNQNVAHLYQPLHPAILRLVHTTCKAAKANGITTQMCGEMAADPLCAPVLLGLGIDGLSMHPQAIPEVKQAIRSIDTTQLDAFVAELMQMPSASAVLGLLSHHFGDLVAEHGAESRPFP